MKLKPCQLYKWRSLSLWKSLSDKPMKVSPVNFILQLYFTAQLPSYAPPPPPPQQKKKGDCGPDIVFPGQCLCPPTVLKL